MTTTAIPARTLLLNAGREALTLVALQRAVTLVLSGKAHILEAGMTDLHSPSLTVPLPSVICLNRYVHVPFRAVRAPTRRAVLARDGSRCAYCSAPADTVDHVIPRSRGGMHEWANVVAACARCNRRKADRLLVEVGWTLPFTPKPPPPGAALLVGMSAVDPAWRHYLAPAGRAS